MILINSPTPTVIQSSEVNINQMSFTWIQMQFLVTGHLSSSDKEIYEHGYDLDFSEGHLVSNFAPTYNCAFWPRLGPNDATAMGYF